MQLRSKHIIQYKLGYIGVGIGIYSFSFIQLILNPKFACNNIFGDFLSF
jgi:hypothetical protein